MSENNNSFLGEDGHRYRIENDGSVTAIDGEGVAPKRTPEEQSKHSEHSTLDYLLNSHPDRLKDEDAARTRRDKLNKELGMTYDDAALADKRKQLRAGILNVQLKEEDAARARRDKLNKKPGMTHDDAALADKRKQLRAGILNVQMRAKMLDLAQEKQNG